MDTKLMIIEIATNLFQQKGYKGVGVNEILKECNVTKGALYHHFPNGKEELLIVCLKSMEEVITTDIEAIFNRYLTTQEAIQAMIEKLVADFERTGTLTGYTFSSMVSEMGALSDTVRHACSSLYTKIEVIYVNKLIADGFSKEMAHSIAVMMTASIEGGIMLCLTQKSSEPLRIISEQLPHLFKGF